MLQTGIDQLADYSALFYRRKTGLITNPSGVDRRFRSTAELLHRYSCLTALFGPEHGVDGSAAAGEAVAERHNERFGIPEFSLYGSGGAVQLSEEQLGDLELLAFDLQDIGSRFYTFLYTLSDAMAVCGRAGVPVVVFDRPNPLGGVRVEGTLLRPGFESFVGRWPLPVRHGFTAGEFALYVNDRLDPKCELTVIPCRNWHRDQCREGSDGSWINPSPNLSSPHTALIYNGSCLFEGTNLSEGRGTTRPFEWIGAPFLDHRAVAERLNDRKPPGVFYRPCVFTPAAGKFQGGLCRAIQLHVTNPAAFNGFEAGLQLFDAIREMTPEFTVTAPLHLDHLFGDDRLRLNSESIAAILERGREESAGFQRETARHYWLY